MKKFTLIIMAISLSISYVNAEQLESISGLVWDKRFGDVDYSYQNRILAVPPKGTILQVAGIYSTAEKGNPEKVEGLWIWKINEAGEKVSDLRIKNADKVEKYIEVGAFAIAGNEDILLVAKLDNGQSALLRLNSAGNILSTSKLGEGKRISKIVPTDDSNFLLIGIQSSDSFMSKINASGETLWNKVYDRGKSEMLIDGIAAEDGGFVVVENSGKAEKFFMSSSDIWITKFDANVQKVKEISFSGRYGSIARGKGGGYVILYDRSGTASQDIWVKALDKNFTELWEVNVNTINFGLERFKVASLANGDYIAVGPVSGKPWVSYIASTGAKKWDYLEKSTDVSVGTDFIVKDNTCFIVSSVITVNEQLKMLNKIRVIKFQPE